MNRGVKGVRNGIGAQPPVTIYWEPRTGLPPAGGCATRYASWPPKRTRLRTFWLTAARTLSAAAPANLPADDRGLGYAYPTGIELTRTNTEFAVPPDPNGSPAWTSAPLHRDLTILGSVQLSFYAASQNPDTDFEQASRAFPRLGHPARRRSRGSFSVPFGCALAFDVGRYGFHGGTTDRPDVIGTMPETRFPIKSRKMRSEAVAGSAGAGGLEIVDQRREAQCRRDCRQPMHMVGLAANSISSQRHSERIWRNALRRYSSRAGVRVLRRCIW